jgi:hypothetical protein
MVLGSLAGTIGTSFVIGNGAELNNTSNACRIDFDGKIYSCTADGGYNSGGADYAEYFEWLDRNILNEDRRGYFVTLNEDKIVLANENDYILGVVSGYPAIIGNADEDWMGRYIRDDFGTAIMEEYEYEVITWDEET